MPETNTPAVAPGAPAGTSPPGPGSIFVVDSQPTGVNAIEQVIAKQRESSQYQPDAADRSLDAQTRPRDEGGKFVKREPELAEPTGPAEQPAQEVPAEQPLEEEPGTEPAAGEEEVPPLTDEDGEELHVVELPARMEGGDPFVIETDDPALVERVNQLKNGFMRGEQVRREREIIEGDRAELRFIRESLEGDPGAFMLEYVKPEYREDLVVRILASDQELYTKLYQRMDDWAADPRGRELEMAKIEAREERRRRESLEARGRDEALRTRAASVREAVYGMIPEAAGETDAERFVSDALNDIRSHVLSTGAQVTAQDVPAILKDRLRLYRWTPGARAGSSNGVNGRAASPASAAAGQPPAAVTGPGSAGERVRVARARRQEVATAPGGGGVGGAASALRPPAGTGVKGAIDFAKGRLRFG